MIERPILFNADMVRAILNGSKTQTRRVINPQPLRIDGGVPYKALPSSLVGVADAEKGVFYPCKLGKRDDQLWVRETFVLEGNHIEWESDYKPPFFDERPIKFEADEYGIDQQHYWTQPHYKATDPTPELYYEDKEDAYCRWKPSIFMPRWASRIQLEITNVRVERLNDISEADAMAEGIFFKDYGLNQYQKQHEGFSWKETTSYEQCLGTARNAYANLWIGINGHDSWNENPWVWVVEFKVLKP